MIQIEKICLMIGVALLDENMSESCLIEMIWSNAVDLAIS